MVLQVSQLSKSYGETRAVQDVSFEVAAGEILAVLGPSGCGKSTLLELIAGLESLDKGDVRWDGISIRDLPTYRRNFGLMFQDFALFPHRNVFDNVAFGLQMAQMLPDAIQTRVKEALELVGLPGFGKRDVNTLSGGEQQRVALARSLAPQPRLLMLDEPLGSLDRNLRERLVKDLRQILRKLHLTTLYVTHDQEEAFAIADRVVVMNAGMVEQIAPPQQIYCCPRSLFVARFIGLNNLIPAQAQAVEQKTRLESELGIFETQDTGWKGPVTMLLRPDEIQLTNAHPGKVAGVLVEKVFRGGTIRTTIEVENLRLTFDFPSNASLPDVGETIQASFDPDQAIQIFPAE